MRNFNRTDDENITTKEEAVMQCHTQAGSITTNLKVKIDFILPELSATKSLKWDFQVDDSAKGRHNMILGRYQLTNLGLN